MREDFHELVKNKIFVEKTFMDCSLVWPIVLPKDITPPDFAEITSRIATEYSYAQTPRSM